MPFEALSTSVSVSYKERRKSLQRRIKSIPAFLLAPFLANYELCFRPIRRRRCQLFFIRRLSCSSPFSFGWGTPCPFLFRWAWLLSDSRWVIVWVPISYSILRLSTFPTLLRSESLLFFFFSSPKLRCAVSSSIGTNLRNRSLVLE